jgi:hypothetical protein
MVILPIIKLTRESLATVLVAHGVKPWLAIHVADDMVTYDNLDEARIILSRNPAPSHEASTTAQWLAYRAWVRAILNGNKKALEVLASRALEIFMAGSTLDPRSAEWDDSGGFVQ